jgi:acyl carrier protein
MMKTEMKRKAKRKMQEKVFKIMAIVFGLVESEFNLDSSIENVEEWDSLNHMNLVLSLEQEFQIEFSDGEIIEMTSVMKILEILKKGRASENV